MEDNIKISVIMPAYNAEKYIDKAIDSVIYQTYRNWELIIVDDGSKDSTAKIIDTYRDRDKRVVIIHQANSGTASAARNTALKYVTGDYIQLLDADDMLSEDCLEKYVNCIKDKMSEKKIICLPLVYQINEDDQLGTEIAHNSRFLGQELNGEEAFEFSVNWTIAAPFLINSDILRNIGFDEKIINGDELTTRKAFFNADKVFFTEGKYLYRKNTESTTRSPHNMARMIESLITDQNLYKFSVDNHMNERIVHLCLNKWAKDCFAYKAKFDREEAYYSDTDREKAFCIISNNFKQITQIKSFNNINFFWMLIVFCSGSFKKYSSLSKMYQKLWLLKEKRKEFRKVGCQQKPIKS